MLESAQTMAWPSLSVIIPSYNQGKYIERTVLSIFGQNYPGPLQVIVSDGGSTDETVSVLKKYPQVQWWSERDAGFVDAVTKGLAAATGEVVAIQSSDDYYLAGAFEKALGVLQNEKDVVFVTGNELRVREDGEVVPQPRMPYVTVMSPGALIYGAALYIPQHCTFVRRSAVERIGGLRAEVDRCADFDLWYRLLHFGRAVLLPDYLAVYQLHTSQRSQNEAELWLTALRKVVEDPEKDPIYAQRFRPSPEMKRVAFLLQEITWNYSAGGKEGLEKGRALADQTLAQPDSWPINVLDFVRQYASPRPPLPQPEPPLVRRLTHAALFRVKRNRAIRALFGRPPVSEMEPAGKAEEPKAPPDTAETSQEMPDLAWWRRVSVSEKIVK